MEKKGETNNNQINNFHHHYHYSQLRNPGSNPGGRMGNPNLLTTASLSPATPATTATTTATVTVTLVPEAATSIKKMQTPPPPLHTQPVSSGNPFLQHVQTPTGSLRLKSGEQGARPYDHERSSFSPSSPQELSTAAIGLPESPGMSQTSIKRRANPVIASPVTLDRSFKDTEDGNGGGNGGENVDTGSGAPQKGIVMQMSSPMEDVEPSTRGSVSKTRILIGIAIVLFFTAMLGLLIASLVVFSTNATSDFVSSGSKRPKIQTVGGGDDDVTFGKGTGPRMEIKTRGLDVKKYASSSVAFFGAHEGVRVLRSLEENERSKTPPPGGGRKSTSTTSANEGGESIDGIVLEYDVLDYFGYDPDDERVTYDPHVCCCKTGFANACGNSFSPSNVHGGKEGPERGSEYGFSYLMVRAHASSVLESGDTGGRWKLQVYLNSKLLRSGLVDCYFSVTVFYSLDETKDSMAAPRLASGEKGSKDDDRNSERFVKKSKRTKENDDDTTEDEGDRETAKENFYNHRWKDNFTVSWIYATVKSFILGFFDTKDDLQKDPSFS